MLSVIVLIVVFSMVLPRASNVESRVFDTFIIMLSVLCLYCYAECRVFGVLYGDAECRGTPQMTIVRRLENVLSIPSLLSDAGSIGSKSHFTSEE